MIQKFHTSWIPELWLNPFARPASSALLAGAFDSLQDETLTRREAGPDVTSLADEWPNGGC
jgi:hypothetical protein